MIPNKTAQRRDNLIRRLRKGGPKLTPQRRIIIDILLREKSHPSAETILQKARLQAPRMSLSTVYYTLTLLKKEGLVKELEFNTMDNLYEADTSDHLNLVCLGCIAYKGRVYDVSQSWHWKDGRHQALHRSGEDITEALARAPHGEDLLERVLLVAVLAEQDGTD